MDDDLKRKNVQVSLDVHATLTSLMKGRMTYNDVVISLLEKAKIPLVKA